jgi:predicted nucleic acid-binding protein
VFEPRFVLDSNIIISHSNQELDINAFFVGIPDCKKCISVITSIEAIAKPELAAEEILKIQELLGSFIEVDILPPIKNEAAAILRRKQLLLPDAVIAATAILLNATLLSNDPHLIQFSWPGYKVRSIVPIPGT